MLHKSSFSLGMTFGMSIYALIFSILLKLFLDYLDIPLLLISLLGLIYCCVNILKNEKNKNSVISFLSSFL